MKRTLAIIISLIIIELIIIKLNYKEDREYRLKDYRITANETLWSIAVKYAPEDMDIREYIDHLEQDNKIEGKYIYPNQIIKIRAYEGE